MWSCFTAADRAFCRLIWTSTCIFRREVSSYRLAIDFVLETLVVISQIATDVLSKELD